MQGVRDAAETIETFACFGGRVSVIVRGSGSAGSAQAAARGVRARLLEWHDAFTRFDSDSELSRLNAAPQAQVPASALMVRFAEAVRWAGERSGGLVDATLAAEIVSAGYAAHREEPELSLREALGLAPSRLPAGPSPAANWRAVRGDSAAGVVIRPVGVMLDSGGLAKGLLADVIAAMLADHEGFAIDCAGDLRIGGGRPPAREVRVESPFEPGTIHSFEVQAGGVATSGIGRRSWRSADGQPAHHLLDPASGRPAFTGLVQVTARAPSALGAEVLAKTALLRGPTGAAAVLERHGGVLVHDDERVEVIAAAP